jgi:hypothetical protein
MAIGKITGQMLNYNLDRSGSDLVIDGNLAYFDVTNRRVGVNTTSPVTALDVNGNAHIGSISINGNTIVPDAGKKLNLGDVGNVQITGGSANYVLFTDGNGSLSFGSVEALQNLGSFTGVDIQLGANTAGKFQSNVLTLTSVTSVTNGIALLNEALGKLAPAPPSPFPGGQSITLSSTTVTARMASFTQTDNTATQGKNVSAGTSVAVVRSSNYLTSALTAVGPGNTGNVTVAKNGVTVGVRQMTQGSDNGTYGDLVIAMDQDYRNVQPSVPPNFYESFNAYATGTVTGGWNEVYLADSATSGNTNTISWYYDASNPGVPTWSNTSITLTSNSVSYSSTIPHVNSSAGFTLRANVARLSGDTFYSSDTFVVGLAGGAFTTPTAVSYSQAVGIPTPLPRNLYVASGSAYLQTTCGTITGFGVSSSGPSLTAYNSYGTATQAFATGGLVLYKTGTSNQIEETALTIGAVGGGTSAPLRIVNPGSTDTPAYTGTEAPFLSTTGPMTTSDAKVVAAVLKHDITNYSIGYVPVGPNFSLHSSNQYFTFRFARTGVSKFDILYSGTLAGLWVALPGSTLDSTSSLNGWLSLSQPYNGSGIPGANSPGNGSNGCAVGGVASLNSSVTNARITATFGTVSSSSTSNNYIYVRVKLTAGQLLTALQIQPATR